MLAARAEPESLALGGLLDQFAVMQQQTSDQFQNALVMLAQMFGAMHRDHMDQVRGELDQVRRLTEEIRALREDVVSLSSSRAGLGSVNGVGMKVASPDPDPAERCDPRNPEEIHAFVSERLASYERERQSCWNRIVRVVTALQSSG